MKIKGIHAAPALMIIVTALFTAANYIDVSKISGSINPYFTVMILQIVCLGLPGVFFCILRGSTYKGKLHLGFIKPSHLTVIVYSFVVLVCIGVGVSVLMYWLFPGYFIASSTNGLIGSITSSGINDNIYSIICFCVLPAILEEFLIRGIVMAEYAPWGSGNAIIFSALCFGILHFSAVRFPVYFCAGIILALLANMTNSIIVTSIVHIAYNIFAMFFEPYIYKIAAKSGGGLVLLAFIVVCLLLLSLAFFFGRGKKLYRYKAEDNEPSPVVRKRTNGEAPYFLSALLSPTFLLLVVFYIVIIFVI